MSCKMKGSIWTSLNTMCEQWIDINSSNWHKSPVTFSFPHSESSQGKVFPLHFHEDLIFLTQYCLMFRLYNPSCSLPSEGDFNLPTAFFLFFFLWYNLSFTLASCTVGFWSQCLTLTPPLSCSEQWLGTILTASCVSIWVWQDSRQDKTKDNQPTQIQCCFPVGMVSAIQWVG